jgi:hypothetical protein
LEGGNPAGLPAIGQFPQKAIVNSIAEGNLPEAADHEPMAHVEIG